MVGSLSLARRRPVVCLAAGALLSGAALAGWFLAHRDTPVLEPGTLVPVSGTVTLDGKPVKSGFVTFYPNRSRGNTYLRSTGGKIKDGRYELLTFDKKGAARRGVPPGWYRVVVEGFAAPDRGAAAKSSRNGGFVTKATVPGSSDQEALLTPDPPGNPKDFFSNYNQPRAIEVTKTGAEDAYDLALTRPAPRQPPRRQ